jgi:hypothetical protein
MIVTREPSAGTWCFSAVQRVAVAIAICRSGLAPCCCSLHAPPLLLQSIWVSANRRPLPMPAIRRHPNNGLSEMPLLAIGQCISSKILPRSMPSRPGRPARLSSLGSSGGAAQRSNSGTSKGVGGCRLAASMESRRPRILKAVFAFSQDLERHRGVKPSRRFCPQEVLAVPARLALLNILWRIPLSICTAYGLTA